MQVRPLVSVLCPAYNHEPYIEDAIKGILMQQTDFAFEILIHDDASTDNTASIIKQYESKYPEKIKAIYQTDNQYSKGVKILPTYLYPLARGEYIAFNEGDDYWIDPYKLQKQINYMSSNPGCSLCIHSSTVVNAKKEKLNRTIKLRCCESKKITIDEVIITGGGLVATNSMLFRKKHIENPPYFNIAPAGDYARIIQLATMGEVYFINEVMSAYRFNVPNSWSNKTRNKEAKLAFLKKVVDMLQNVNECYKYKYDVAINRRINQLEFMNFRLERNITMIKSHKYRENYNALSAIKKIKLHLELCVPETINYIENVYYKLTKRV